jgi:hypothetical protein
MDNKAQLQTFNVAKPLSIKLTTHHLIQPPALRRFEQIDKLSRNRMPHDTLIMSQAKAALT